MGRGVTPPALVVSKETKVQPLQPIALKGNVNMSKLLKLSGVASLTTPKFNDTVVLRKQVIRVDDDLADKLLKGERPRVDDDPVPHWLDVTGTDAKVDHDFSTKGAAELTVTAANADSAAKDVDDPKAAPKAAARRTSQRAS